MKNIDLSIIIPCYNEEQNVTLVYNECLKVFGKEKVNVQYIMINDGSKDNTFAEIKKIANNNLNVIALSFSRNFGKEAAIYSGLNKADGKYVAIMDADLQQDPKYVLKMYNFIEENNKYDVVCCYQKKRKENNVITFLKKMFYNIINKISDIQFFENASDFRLFNRKVTNSILNLKEYYRFSKGFFSWIGFNTYFMPYEVNERKFGKSSWSVWSLFKYAMDGIIGFSIKPLKIATWVGFFGFVVSIIYLIIVLIQKIFVGIDFSGYATIVSLILMFGSLQMIFLGIIGEYLGRIYIETKKRPIYIIDEEINTK